MIWNRVNKSQRIRSADKERRMAQKRNTVKFNGAWYTAMGAYVNVSMDASFRDMYAGRRNKVKTWK